MESLSKCYWARRVLFARLLTRVLGRIREADVREVRHLITMETEAARRRASHVNPTATNSAEVKAVWGDRTVIRCDSPPQRALTCDRDQMVA